MYTIKRDTIIKPGDRIINTASKEEWEVLKIDGLRFFLKNVHQEQVLTKFDLVIRPELKLKPKDGRGYY